MTFDWSVVTQHGDQLLRGALVTVALTAATMALAVPLGLLLALMRLCPLRLVRLPAVVFVELFRSTPLLLQVYWVFYVLPALTGIAFSAIATGLTGLVCNIASYNAETFRAGIRSIRPGQTNAALALGMSRAQAFRKVVLPQAMTRVMPPLATTWVSLFKDTSLVSTIAVADLSYEALQLRAMTYRTLEVLTAMAAIYWLLGYPQAKLADWVYRRFRTSE
jgi:polar amino acid transport system permease protein